MQALFVSLCVYLCSLWILPYYTEGDLINYNAVYESLKGVDLIAGFGIYAGWLGSYEPIHFIFSWVFSNVGLERIQFIAILNAILGLSFVILCEKYRVNNLIAITLVFMSFYFMVLFTELERLKLAFIFFFSSLYFYDSKKRSFLLSLLCLFTHVQFLVIYAGALLVYFQRQSVKVYREKKINKSFLVLVIVGLAFVLIMRHHIIYKLMHYYSGLEFVALIKFLPFVLLSLLYARKKVTCVVFFMPISILVLLVGGSRLNIFGYFIFLYYALQYRRGLNLGVVVTSVYFGIQSIVFLSNIFETGRGYDF
jgi:hypothetical protein